MINKTTIGTNCEGLVQVSIEYNSGNLSITGEIYENGREVSGGQINPIDTTNMHYVGAWNDEMVEKLNSIWEIYHLNDKKAGTPAQTVLVREYRKTNRGYYTDVCNYLESVNMLSDDGYIYGTQWLRIEVPNDVIEWLATL